MKNHVVFNEPDVALFVPDHDPLIFYRRLIELGISQEPAPAKYFAFEIHEDFGPEMLALPGIFAKRHYLKARLSRKE